MPTRTADAEWNGHLTDGAGTMRFGSGAFEGPYSFASRFTDEAGRTGTNPEELVAGAAAGCYSMALSGDLGAAGHNVTSVRTTADVTVEKDGGGFTITGIILRTEAEVAGVDGDEFQRIAEGTRQNCPVARLLTGAPLTLEAKLN